MTGFVPFGTGSMVGICDELIWCWLLMIVYHTLVLIFSGQFGKLPYILEYNLHPFCSFRELKKSDAD
jgi:hypothetical protein